MALVRPHTQDPLRHGPAAQRAVLLPEGSLPACWPCLLTPVGVAPARGVPGLQEREDPIPGNPTQLAGKVRRAAPRPQICAPRCMAPQLLAHSRPLQLHNTHSCTQAHPGLVCGPALPIPPMSLAAVLPPYTHPWCHNTRMYTTSLSSAATWLWSHRAMGHPAPGQGKEGNTSSPSPRTQLLRHATQRAQHSA